MLVLQVGMGAKALRTDWTSAMSSSKAFGQYLRDHPEWRDAVLVAEPDWVLESLPYYAGNPIYLTREDRFGKTVCLTSAAKALTSLDGLMATADRLAARRGGVLVVLGSAISGAEPGVLDLGAGRHFTYCRASWEVFQSRARFLAEFSGSTSGEDYRVYAWQ
jgi:hypothetical protein